MNFLCCPLCGVMFALPTGMGRDVCGMIVYAVPLRIETIGPRGDIYIHNVHQYILCEGTPVVIP